MVKNANFYFYYFFRFPTMSLNLVFTLHVFDWKLQRLYNTPRGYVSYIPTITRIYKGKCTGIKINGPLTTFEKNWPDSSPFRGTYTFDKIIFSRTIPVVLKTIFLERRRKLRNHHFFYARRNSTETTIHSTGSMEGLDGA